MIVKRRPRQKEFGLNEFRDKIAAICDDVSHHYKLKSRRAISSDLVAGYEKLDKELIKALEKYKAVVVDAPLRPSSNIHLRHCAGVYTDLNKQGRRQLYIDSLLKTINDEEIDPYYRKHLENILRAVKDTKNNHVISLGNMDLSNSLIHEIGHIKNRTDESLFKRFISYIDNTSRATSESLEKTDTSLLKTLLENSITIAEENNAWDSGKKLITNSKVLTPEEKSRLLRLTNKLQKESVDTYRNGSISRNWGVIRNKIKTRKFKSKYEEDDKSSSEELKWTKGS